MDEASETSRSWQIYYHTVQSWEAMYRDCEQAKTSIEFEQYKLEAEGIGQHFIDLFIEKAQSGVEVTLILDVFGSKGLYFSSDMREFRRSGGHVRFYNSAGGWVFVMPWRYFPRTHVKTLLIDSEVAYIGGVCLSEEMRDWRDTHLRVTGPVTKQVSQAFEDLRRHRRMKQSFAPMGDAQFSYFVNQPTLGRCAIYQQLIHAISKAERYIYFTSPYFIPNRKFVKKLNEAHQRGVEIRVLIPQSSDVKLVDYIGLSYTPRYHLAGIRVFRFQPTVMHSKTVMIDDNWATIGSTNMEIMSFFHNREGNMVIHDPELVKDLRSHFLDDLKESNELTYEVWQLLPLWKKLLGFMGRTLRIFF